MYEFTFDSKSVTNTMFDVGFNVLYQILPVKYNLKLSSGTDQKIDNTHTIRDLTILLYYNSPFFGLTPNIGLKSTDTEIKPNNDGQSKSNNVTAFVFGIDNKF